LYMAPDTSYNSQYKSRNEGYSSANHRASVIVKTKQWDACLIALASNKGVHNNNASTLLHYNIRCLLYLLLGGLTKEGIIDIQASSSLPAKMSRRAMASVTESSSRNLGPS